MPGNEIRITPGGFITNKPRHLIGLRGASPFLTNPATIAGFQNLRSLYGDTAFPVINSASDGLLLQAEHYLGNETQGSQNCVDMVSQPVMSRIHRIEASDTTGRVFLNINGEFVHGVQPAATPGANVVNELFGKPGGTTVTVTAGSPTVVGAGGTLWTTQTLAGGYGVTNPNLNLIMAGDAISIQASAGHWILFRIIKVTDNTHIDIWPTPTAGNPAIGAGKTYEILRTGYNSYSRVLGFNVYPGPFSYFYYVGNLYARGVGAGASYPHGTIQCASVPYFHYMSPQLVDSSGTAVGELMADDLVYFKGYFLYGAGPAIGWSVPGAPSVLPFGNTDFPAKNVSAFAPDDNFVSFELLGDQCVAFFEESLYLVVPTGSDPAFTFYKMPELLGIVHPSVAEPSGMVPASFNHGRPSASGRGAVYYISNRGVESMGGGLSSESSAPVSTAIKALFGTSPLYVGWNCGDNTVLVRNAMGTTGQIHLLFNPETNDWSTISFASPTGGPVIAALTPGIQPQPSSSDHTRLQHYAYYDPRVGANGAAVMAVNGLLDDNTPSTGLIGWKWYTPVIPLGLEYPEFSTGGFVYDAYTLNGPGTTVTWALLGGSSPYNLFQRDSGTMTFAGTLQSPWVSSRQRLSKKIDDPFVMLTFTSTAWVATLSVTLFESKTQAMR